jgi:hypothetical protein
MRLSSFVHCSDALDEDLDVLHELQNLKLYRSYIHRYRFRILILGYNLANQIMTSLNCTLHKRITARLFEAF